MDKLKRKKPYTERHHSRGKMKGLPKRTAMGWRRFKKWAHENVLLFFKPTKEELEGMTKPGVKAIAKAYGCKVRVATKEELIERILAADPPVPELPVGYTLRNLIRACGIRKKLINERAGVKIAPHPETGKMTRFSTGQRHRIVADV